MLRNKINGDYHDFMLRLPKSLVKDLKLIAVEKDKSLRRLIRDVLEDFAKKNRSQ